jgi:isocitrate dehydrogenase
MKLTDGLFHRVYDEVSEDYPSIEKEHFIIDIGSARIASRPEHFDVIVTENLYGDIISDIAAETSGSVGLAGSANIGEDFGMFEAIHGSAPDIAGQDIANPSGLLNGAVMMLVHIGQGKVAEKIQNAWLRTLEDGMHTGDIFGPKSAEKLGTQAFAEAVCKRLGQLPQEFTPVEYPELPEREKKEYVPSPELSQEKTLIGVDVFISWSSPDINMLAKRLIECAGDTLELKIISCKGLKVWPDYESGSNLAEQYRCRFRVIGASGTAATVSALLKRITSADLEFLKAINLYAFDGTPGFSMSQGE